MSADGEKKLTILAGKRTVASLEGSGDGTGTYSIDVSLYVPILLSLDSKIGGASRTVVWRALIGG